MCMYVVDTHSLLYYKYIIRTQNLYCQENTINFNTNGLYCCVCVFLCIPNICIPVLKLNTYIYNKSTQHGTSIGMHILFIYSLMEVFFCCKKKIIMYLQPVDWGWAFGEYVLYEILMFIERKYNFSCFRNNNF